MNKFLIALHSRTAWTTILLVLVNVIPGLNLAQPLKDLLNAVLGALVVYFRINATNLPTPAIPPTTPSV